MPRPGSSTDRRILHCLRCEYRWSSSLNRPQNCPSCHCDKWDADQPAPRDLRCQQCGYQWQTRRGTLPRRCPACESSGYDGKPIRPENLAYCHRCEYRWRSKAPNGLTKLCPQCGSAKWDDPTIPKRPKATCLSCGHTWRRGNMTFKVCPNCKSDNWKDEEMKELRT
jgi:predicted Zn-ribbon and HTH transcriptional regulator